MALALCDATNLGEKHLRPFVKAMGRMGRPAAGACRSFTNRAKAPDVVPKFKHFELNRFDAIGLLCASTMLGLIASSDNTQSTLAGHYNGVLGALGPFSPLTESNHIEGKDVRNISDAVVNTYAGAILSGVPYYFLPLFLQRCFPPKVLVAETCRSIARFNRIGTPMFLTMVALFPFLLPSTRSIFPSQSDGFHKTSLAVAGSFVSALPEAMSEANGFGITLTSPMALRLTGWVTVRLLTLPAFSQAIHFAPEEQKTKILALTLAPMMILNILAQKNIYNTCGQTVAFKRVAGIRVANFGFFMIPSALNAALVFRTAVQQTPPLMPLFSETSSATSTGG